ncbi:GNAT family N-acetyltransferase [Lysinibacter cavernae]|uniref:Putative GNAT superfamily acetyltransferase n=1 Tax=Lysinibacter cavernae TaxID=1640652 RepID=A0A7X5TRI9_9MICO|nr:GNAT family N-acetyltransferase [Lysinibacter cavernae]NIH52236.1 putative GNAT superfamily acetyltransferase [Lysinibacter cavernae]
MTGESQSDLQIRVLSSGDELGQASALYRNVFGYDSSTTGLSPRLMRSLVDNGGIVLGAVTPQHALVGLIYGFTGHDGNGFFHYSQAAAIAPEAQGKGLGRQLKQTQAELARGMGFSRMRWTYDPTDVRNGHFNLNVLGGNGIRFYPDYYQDDGSDRILIEWALNSDAAQQPESAGQPGVTVPAGIRQLRITDPETASAVSARVRSELEAGFAGGGILSSCERQGDGSAIYRFGTMAQPTAGKATV